MATVYLLREIRKHQPQPSVVTVKEKGMSIRPPSNGRVDRLADKTEARFERLEDKIESQSEQLDSLTRSQYETRALVERISGKLDVLIDKK